MHLSDTCDKMSFRNIFFMEYVCLIMTSNILYLTSQRISPLRLLNSSYYYNHIEIDHVHQKKNHSPPLSDIIKWHYMFDWICFIVFNHVKLTIITITRSARSACFSISHQRELSVISPPGSASCLPSQLLCRCAGRLFADAFGGGPAGAPQGEQVALPPWCTT